MFMWDNGMLFKTSIYYLSIVCNLWNQFRNVGYRLPSNLERSKVGIRAAFGPQLSLFWQMVHLPVVQQGGHFLLWTNVRQQIANADTSCFLG